ncbi:MAG: type II/IV secretion system protein, partial [Candidatus Omnitrophica bacterium]|nr:type II/IV secretion system protein [Candidatus Omnitrophota bacterium]
MTGPQLQVQAIQEAMAAAGAGGISAEAARDSAKLLELASQAPVIRLVDQCLSEAVKRRASDVHIETFEDAVLIRFRIDGACYEVARPPMSLALALASRIKILANLDVAESRLPQDGRILLTYEGRQIDLRVSTLPTIYGESIVLRVLDKSSLNKTLAHLGMGAALEAAMERIIRRPHGLFLVTGPTGSGKTTTLYGCLSSLNRPEVKIITTEDPVEYDVAGLVQVAINQKISLDFATCLRSILRHDPDIIMVGEIRDAETAQVAIQAALTGHLVFSTLHTNDAPGAVTRLLDMGLEPFLITSTVIGVLAQRLVRRLCAQCRAPAPPTEEELTALRLSPAEWDALQAAPAPEGAGGASIVHHAMAAARGPMRPVGCEACQGLGYQGRTGIFELLEMNEQIRPMVLERRVVSEIRAAAKASGMRSLREYGLEQVLRGETTIAEVLRETQDAD